MADCNPLSIVMFTADAASMSSLNVAVIVMVSEELNILSVSEYVIAAVGAVLSTSKVPVEPVGVPVTAFPPISTPFDSVIVAVAMFPAGFTSE